MVQKILIVIDPLEILNIEIHMIKTMRSYSKYKNSGGWLQDIILIYIFF